MGTEGCTRGLWGLSSYLTAHGYLPSVSSVSRSCDSNRQPPCEHSRSVCRDRQARAEACCPSSLDTLMLGHPAMWPPDPHSDLSSLSTFRSAEVVEKSLQVLPTHARPSVGLLILSPICKTNSN